MRNPFFLIRSVLQSRDSLHIEVMVLQLSEHLRMQFWLPSNAEQEIIDDISLIHSSIFDEIQSVEEENSCLTRVVRVS